MATFKERLRSLRESRSMTQDDLADVLGVSKQAISQYERGVRRPDFETLSTICDLFNVSLDFLLGKSDLTTRLLDEHEVAMIDGYYTNPETAEIAQRIFENKDLRLLFDAAQDTSAENIQLLTELLVRIKKQESKNTDT